MMRLSSLASLLRPWRALRRLALLGALAAIPMAPLWAASPSAHSPSTFAQEQAMSPASLLDRWTPLIAEAARRFHVPQDWIRAVIRMESGGRTMMGENLPVTSTMGALGIMQVMPETYAEMRLQYGLGPDPHNPHDNVIAGTAYLKFLAGKYGNPGMFAAYDDGPGNFDAFLTAGRSLPAETHDYVARISRILGQPEILSRLTKVEFTRPDGTPVEIDASQVSAIRPALPGEYPAGVRSVLSIGRVRQAVCEDVAPATEALRAHGAKV